MSKTSEKQEKGYLDTVRREYFKNNPLLQRSLLETETEKYAEFYNLASDEVKKDKGLYLRIMGNQNISKKIKDDVTKYYISIDHYINLYNEGRIRLSEVPLEIKDTDVFYNGSEDKQKKDVMDKILELTDVSVQLKVDTVFMAELFNIDPNYVLGHLGYIKDNQIFYNLTRKEQKTLVIEKPYCFVLLSSQLKLDTEFWVNYFNSRSIVEMSRIKYAENDSISFFTTMTLIPRKILDSDLFFESTKDIQMEMMLYDLHPLELLSRQLRVVDDIHHWSLFLIHRRNDISLIPRKFLDDPVFYDRTKEYQKKLFLDGIFFTFLSPFYLTERKRVSGYEIINCFSKNMLLNENFIKMAAITSKIDELILDSPFTLDEKQQSLNKLYDMKYNERNGGQCSNVDCGFKTWLWRINRESLTVDVKISGEEHKTCLVSLANTPRRILISTSTPNYTFKIRIIDLVQPYFNQYSLSYDNIFTHLFYLSMYRLSKQIVVDDVRQDVDLSRHYLIGDDLIEMIKYSKFEDVQHDTLHCVVTYINSHIEYFLTLPMYPILLNITNEKGIGVGVIRQFFQELNTEILRLRYIKKHVYGYDEGCTITIAQLFQALLLSYINNCPMCISGIDDNIFTEVKLALNAYFYASLNDSHYRELLHGFFLAIEDNKYEVKFSEYNNSDLRADLPITKEDLDDMLQWLPSLHSFYWRYIGIGFYMKTLYTTKLDDEYIRKFVSRFVLNTESLDDTALRKFSMTSEEFRSKLLSSLLVIEEDKDLLKSVIINLESSLVPRNKPYAVHVYGGSRLGHSIHTCFSSMDIYINTEDETLFPSNTDEESLRNAWSLFPKNMDKESLKKAWYDRDPMTDTGYLIGILRNSKEEGLSFTAAGGHQTRRRRVISKKNKKGGNINSRGRG